MSEATEREPASEDPPTGLGRIRASLFAPVDVASVAVFRMMFGAVLVWEVWRFFHKGWIKAYYVSPEFHFKYFGFGWVEAWSGDGMYYHFVFVGLVAFLVMIGLFYRVASWLLFVSFTYWFLLDQTRYLNHLYLTALLTFLMAVLPAHRAWSADARLWPKRRSDTIPAWTLWLLRAQIAIVYFYAGIAKLNSDWLQGEPIRRWLARRDGTPVVGPFLDTEAAVWLFAYGGMLFDLLIVPALLWRKSRPWALAACVVFHATNKWMFNIGIFPILMMAATLLFLPPDWPRKVGRFVRRKAAPADDARQGEVPSGAGGRRRTVECLLVAYLGLQLLFPLRHLLYPGNVHWTEEGHRFSWRMKLREKRASANFVVTIPSTGELRLIDHREWLTTHQGERFGRWPDMVLQFAHFLADDFRAQGLGEVEVRVVSHASLNGRDPQPLIDPYADLAKQPRSLWPAEWIEPLEEPLRKYPREVKD